MKTIKKILKGNFVKNIFTLASGTTIAQLIVVLSTPILTRIFSPEDFGVYGVFMAITAILATVVNLGFQHALIIPKYNYSSQILLRLCFIIACVLSLTVFLFLLVYETLLKEFFYIEELHAVFVWSIPIMMLLLGLTQPLQNFLVRRKQFKTLAYSHAIRPSTMVISQMSLGLLAPFGLVGLIIGHLIGQLSAVLYIIKKKSYIYHLMVNNKWKKVQYKTEFNTHKNFPLYYVPSEFVGSFSLQVPILFLSFLFNPYIVGLYLMGHRILTIPSKVVGNAIATVFFKKANDDKGKNNQVSFKLWSVLFPISIMIFGILIFFAPSIFALVLGDEWRKAGIYSQWIALWMIFQFVNRPLMRISLVYSKQKITFWLQIILLTLRVLALFIGAYYQSPLLSIILFSLVSGIYTAFNSSLFVSWESGKKYGRIVFSVNILVILILSYLLL